MIQIFMRMVRISF